MYEIGKGNESKTKHSHMYFELILIVWNGRCAQYAVYIGMFTYTRGRIHSYMLSDTTHLKENDKWTQRH